MNLLLDTHILIWVFLHPEKLTASVQQVLERPENNIYVSVLSLWEISLKYSNGKLTLSGIDPEDFLSFIEKSGFKIKPVSEKEAATFHQLTAVHHKDPFDRMMIWQAICNNYTFITDDKQVKKYVSAGLRIL